MIGERMWATGITVVPTDSRPIGSSPADLFRPAAWRAYATIHDNGFLVSGVVQGRIETRYAEETPLAAARAVLEALQAMNVVCPPGQITGWYLYVEGDGEGLPPDCPLPPDWREQLVPVADELGFFWPYLDRGDGS